MSTKQDSLWARSTESFWAWLATGICQVNSREYDLTDAMSSAEALIEIHDGARDDAAAFRHVGKTAIVVSLLACGVPLVWGLTLMHLLVCLAPLAVLYVLNIYLAKHTPQWLREKLTSFWVERFLAVFPDVPSYACRFPRVRPYADMWLERNDVDPEPFYALAAGSLQSVSNLSEAVRLLAT